MVKSKVAAIAGVAMLCALPAIADPIQMPLKAAAGTVWKVERKQTTATTLYGQTSEKAAAHSATLKVVEVAGDGFVMEWTTESVTGDATGIDGIAPGLLSGVVVRFKADKTGLPVELANPEPVVAAVIGGMSGRGVSEDSPALAGAKNTLLGMTPSVLAAHMLGDAAAIASCQGVTVEKGKQLKRMATSPKIGNSPTVDMTVTTTLEESGSARQPARIRIVEVADQESIRKALMEAARMRSPPGAPLPPVDKMAASTTRTTTRTCSVDVQSGNALAVTVETVVGFDTRLVKDVHSLTVSRAQ